MLLSVAHTLLCHLSSAGGDMLHLSNTITSA